MNAAMLLLGAFEGLCKEAGPKATGCRYDRDANSSSLLPALVGGGML